MFPIRFNLYFYLYATLSRFKREYWDSSLGLKTWQATAPNPWAFSTASGKPCLWTISVARNGYYAKPSPSAKACIEFGCNANSQPSKTTNARCDRRHSKALTSASAAHPTTHFLPQLPASISSACNHSAYLACRLTGPSSPPLSTSLPQTVRLVMLSAPSTCSLRNPRNWQDPSQPTAGQPTRCKARGP